MGLKKEDVGNRALKKHSPQGNKI